MSHNSVIDSSNTSVRKMCQKNKKTEKMNYFSRLVRFGLEQTRKKVVPLLYFHLFSQLLLDYYTANDCLTLKLIDNKTWIRFTH